MSISLTRREKLIVLYVLISLIVGAGVKRWREHQEGQEITPARDAQVAESD